MSCICIYFVCVYVYMYSCVILNNSALKFSRGRGHEARPWKPILQSLRNIFRYIQKRPLDPLIRVWTKSFACTMHSDWFLTHYLIAGEFHVAANSSCIHITCPILGDEDTKLREATTRMVSTMWYAFVEIYLAKSLFNPLMPKIL